MYVGSLLSDKALQRNKHYVLLVLFLILSGCSRELLNWNAKATEISGKLLGTTTTSSSLNASNKSTTVSSLCAGATAKLYQIDASGEIIQPELGKSALTEDGSYSFKARDLGFEIKNGKPSLPLVVRIEGCGEILSRPVTGSRDQDVSQGSTLLGYVLNTGEKQKLAETLLSQQDKINSLIKALQAASTVDEAYQSLTINDQFREIFVEILGASPAILTEAAPQILSLSIPEEGGELQAISISVSTGHWSPDYDTVHVWKIDNTQLSTNTSFTYTAGANAQGTHTISLFVGKDNGSGGLDQTKPYKVLTRTIVIQNTVPAVAPTLSLVTTSPTGNTSISVALNTGAALANCASFSKLALTVDEPAAPLDLTRYDITCSQAGSQNLSVTLPTGDGTKVLRLWALDASNNISSTASTVSIILEQNPPVVSVQNLASLIRGGSNQTISFAAQDLGVGLEDVILEYATDGVNFSEVTSYTNPSAITFSEPWTVPTQNTTTAVLRVRAKDKAGNWSSASTSAFEIDSLAPSLSLTSLNSGTYLGGSSQNITWSASDLHLGSSPIKLEYTADSGATWTTIVAATANSGSYSWSLPVINSAQVRVRVTATDLAGNFTQESSSSALTIDSSPPSLPTLSLVSATYSNSSTVNLSLSTCSDVAKILINESFVQPAAGAAGWQACTLTPSYIVSGEGLHTLQLWVQDSVGNVNSSSVSTSMTLDTTAPMVSLTSLNSGSFRGGEVQNLTWSASDVNLSATPIKLEYSSDNGGTWSTLVASNSNSGSYAWTLPMINSTAVKVRVTMTDLANNSTSVVSSGSLTIDSAAPGALGLTRTSSSPNNSQNVDLTVANCSGDAVAMFFSESSTTPYRSDTGWEVCAANKTFAVSSGDGAKAIYAWAKDAVGNISAVSSASMILDKTVPNLSLTTFQSGAYIGGTTQIIAWNAVDANFITGPINIEYSVDGGATWLTIQSSVNNAANSCTVPVGSTGCYNWLLPTIDNAQVKVRLTATDQVGLQTVVSSMNAFVVDSTVPVLASFNLNDNVAITTSNIISSGLSAADNIAKITHFCLKYTMGIQTPSKPSVADTCWVSVNAPSPGVTPSLNISFNNYFYALGLTNGQYKVFAWVKNEAGLISDISNADSGTVGVDYRDIEYSPGVPATVVNVIAVNSDIHATPPTASEATVNSGQNLIVKWKATDDSAFPSNNIKIYYTLDEETYTLLADNVSNQASGGCTVDGTDYTGCYVVPAPASSYFKIRLSVLDASQKVTLASAIPNNLGAFRILAGNTETGIGGSANSAVFNVASGGTTAGLPGTLAVADDGTVYIRDTVNGILKVNPSTGVVESLLPFDGVGSDGPLGAARLRMAGTYITVDYNNNLLIYDYDRVRKFDVSTNTLTTFIGGGSSRTSGASALNFKFNSVSYCARCYVAPLPNGDILLVESSGEKVIWRYKAADQKVYALNLSGTGMTGRSASDDVGSADYSFQHFSVEFDVTTSEISTLIAQFSPVVCPGCGSMGYPAFIDSATGNTIPSPTPASFIHNNFKPSVPSRDGKIYQIGVEGVRRLGRYNKDTNSWTTILGTTTVGYCEDGTDALSCNINIMDAFVTSDSRVFFIDSGLVRTIDSSGKVQTVFGQRLSYGDGGLATSARIQAAHFFDYTSTGDIVFLDGLQHLVRRFTPGGTIERVMGNGNSQGVAYDGLAINSPMVGSWWGGRYQVMVDRSTDDIYINQGSSIGRILKSDNKIYRVLGNGGTSYSVADGLLGSSISIGSESAQLLAVENGKMLVAMSSRNASAQNYKCYMKEYDINDSFRQSHIAGNDDLCSGSTSAVGSPTATANTGNMSTNGLLPAQWLSDIGGWTQPRQSSKNVLAYVPGGVVTEVKVGLPRNVLSVTTVVNASNQRVLYYCDTSNLRVYKYNTATSTETALNWPNSAYACTGYSIRYSSARSSVIFPMKQNGLMALVEIVDIP